jgi:hypothetical protein
MNSQIFSAVLYYDFGSCTTHEQSSLRLLVIAFLETYLEAKY